MPFENCVPELYNKFHERNMKLWNKSLIGQLLVFIPLFGFCLGGRRGTTVKTNSGKVRGGVSISRLQREFYSWKGIPYAEPPVGQLRYAVRVFE